MVAQFSGMILDIMFSTNVALIQHNSVYINGIQIFQIIWFRDGIRQFIRDRYRLQIVSNAIIGDYRCFVAVVDIVEDDIEVVEVVDDGNVEVVGDAEDVEEIGDIEIWVEFVDIADIIDNFDIVGTIGIVGFVDTDYIDYTPIRNIHMK
uniref:Uncharacterized protein n=1 Tax=Rhizophagus irregularis (strain DAOM 181602 / DAOM 197198 / MUCL 43194) TaxID=747089 RepID=U9U3H7_RHIID